MQALLYAAISILLVADEIPKRLKYLLSAYFMGLAVVSFFVSG